MSLNQIELYEKSNPIINTTFLDNVESKLDVHIDIKKKELNTEEWIEMILFSIPYLYKALEMRNKQIITEEDIVKVELVKKVSVETVKHLSKNTNFIDEIDEETGDVKPSKLLEAHKEENFITYENRFIYTLVLLITDFINYKKGKGLFAEGEKNIKKVQYEAKSKVEKQRITIKSEVEIDESDLSDKTEQNNRIAEGLAKIDEGLEQLYATEIFKLLSSKRTTLVKPPLKMTNVLLKNVNFQYAVKLWNYLNDNFVSKNEPIRDQRDFEDKSLLLTMFNESFLLNYLDFNLIETKDKRKLMIQVDDKEIIKKITDNLMLRILELNPNITEAQLKELLAENYIRMKGKYSSNTKQVEELFSRSIKLFMNNIRGIEVRK